MDVPSGNRPRIYADPVPPPTRRAPMRTAAAIVEDLTRARWLGGLQRCEADDLTATLDWLSLAGIHPRDEPLLRARDLLLHYVKVVCAAHQSAEDAGKTEAVAAVTLERLLLRPPVDNDLVETVRREATQALGHYVSGDAVRHSEGRLINEVADLVAEDLAKRRLDVPQTVEAAVHNLAPIVVDHRQDLHDGLCVIYQGVPIADPQDRQTVELFYDTTIVQLADILVAATRLVEVGLRAPDLEGLEFGIIWIGRQMVQSLFTSKMDRSFILEFMQTDAKDLSFAECLEALRRTARGDEIADRCREWIQSCYDTCAFERTTNNTYMCSPHAFLTLLYDFEVLCRNMGYSNLEVPFNEPLRHHRLRGADQRLT